MVMSSELLAKRVTSPYTLQQVTRCVVLFILCPIIPFKNAPRMCVSSSVTPVNERPPAPFVGCLTRPLKQLFLSRIQDYYHRCFIGFTFCQLRDSRGESSRALWGGTRLGGVAEAVDWRWHSPPSPRSVCCG